MRPNGHGEDFRLHFAGCSSSCAQHQIADVGIEGVLKKFDGEFIEAMDIRIGGRLGENPQFGTVVVKKVPNWELNDTLLRIFTLYETAPRRGRDVPRLRGPDRARVVDAGAHPGRRAGRVMSVAEVLAEAVERHGDRLVMLCSFQKEESVLVDELVRARARRPHRHDRHRRAVPRDARHLAGVRGALRHRRRRSRTRRGDWTGPEHCCGERKVAALERALAGADAWITGIRREQSPTRANAQTVEFDDNRGIWKYNPLVEWTEKDLWKRIFERDLPYHPLHDQGYASIGCAPCTNPGSGREGRWAGLTKTECGLHV